MTQANEPQQNDRQAKLIAASGRCRGGDDTGCAELLEDHEVWNKVIADADVDATRSRSLTLLRRACNGGHTNACGAIEGLDIPAPPAPASAPSTDPDALRRMMAALETLQTLSDRWVAQLDVLSKTRCASGAEGEIAAEWNKGAPKRSTELEKLDATVTAITPEIGESWAKTWTIQRDAVVRRLAVTLERAQACEEQITDPEQEGLRLLLEADGR